MKQRTITSLFLIFLILPIIYKGGLLFHLFVYALSIFALKEIITIKETKKAIPDLIKFISYIVMTLFVLYHSSQMKQFVLDYKIIAATFLLFLLSVMFYHDEEKYSVSDALYLVGTIFFIGISFSLLQIINSIHVNYVIYIFLIACITDSYSYLIGNLIGKHPVMESIDSFKKWEGLIGGVFFGTLLPYVFLSTVVHPNSSQIILFLMTLFLSVLGQFGDLFFSAMKKYFNKERFSNLMPGHGGVLDRFDSIIFITLGFIFFIGGIL